MQELVKAGCDLDKLPVEILSAIENACLTDKPNKVDEGFVDNRVDEANIKSQLIRNLQTLQGSRHTCNEAQSAIKYVADKDYSRALREITNIINYQNIMSSSTTNEQRDAALKSSELIGKLI